MGGSVVDNRGNVTSILGGFEGFKCLLTKEKNSSKTGGSN